METLTLRSVASRGDGTNVHIDYYPTNESLPKDQWIFGCDATFTEGNLNAVIAENEIVARQELLRAISVDYPNQYE